MSWFDTKNFTSLAKSALKEAQRKIDAALDITQEDDASSTDGGTAASATKTLPERSKTEPNTPTVDTAPTTQLPSSASDTFAELRDDGSSSSIVETGSNRTGTLAASTWGSFTGSFFENPKANEMITTPPKASGAADVATVVTTAPFAGGAKRQSVTSNSDSVELLSSPISPYSSELATPSDPAAASTSSVDLLTTASSVATTMDCSASLPDSIVIIAASHEGGDDDEEDESVSFNTVMDDNDTTMVAVAVDQMNATGGDMAQSLQAIRAPTQRCSSAESLKHPSSLKDMSFESQTVDSDSTQSFEELYMQTSGSAKAQARHGAAARSSGADESAMTKAASSPPNSNDEMETTTSSDIEIISNPNGDSSSTNSASRTSPLKCKRHQDPASSALAAAVAISKKGHCRELSEISILSEDSSQSELDKLVQRNSELNGILATHEQRLLESERQNVRLQEVNHELQATLAALKTTNSTASLHTSDEYTQRLSALEKKFQASIREQEALRTQIKTLNVQLREQVPKEDMVRVVGEKEAMIAELRLEGEKLSKEVLQQSNIIKKLRLKEKSSDGVLKRNKEQIATLTDETERLKKTLTVKEDVERSQIEAVHKMSSAQRKLDDDNAQLRSQHEDLQSKLATLQASFEAARTELQQRARLHTDLTRTVEEAQSAKRERATACADNAALHHELDELRDKLRSVELLGARRQQQWREERHLLMERVEAAELRAEASTQEVGMSTMPLMRQLQALQSTLSQRTTNWQKEEQQLLQQLDAKQTRLMSLERAEATANERADLLQARCIELEEKLSHALMQTEQFKLMLQQAQLDYDLKATDLQRQVVALNDRLDERNGKIAQLEADNLRDSSRIPQLIAQRLQTGAAERDPMPAAAAVPQQRELSAAALNEMTAALAEPEQAPRAQSPALSYDGMNSMDEAMGASSSVDWHADDLECISNSGRALGYGINFNLMGHNTTTLEHLQALLKQRDGEVSHLQWELSRLQAERGLLTEEMSNLTMELENLKEKLLTYEALEKNYDDLQHRYDALLQMYGEKVERTEELELDLTELKEAYKAQIDELLAQPPQPLART